MKRVLLFVAAAALTLPFLAPAAGAAEGGLGVAPGIVDLRDPALLPGAIRETYLSVQNGLDEAATLTATPTGAPADWITVEPSELRLQPGESASLLVRIAVPEEAVAGDYAGAIKILAESGDKPDGSGAAVAMELRPALKLRVGGDRVVAYSLEGVDVDVAERGSPLLLTARVLNNGNVAGAPQVRVQVHPADGGASVLDETLDLPRVEPQAKEALPIATSGSLPAAAEDYRVTVTLTGQGAAGAEPWTLVTHAAPQGSSGGVTRGTVASADADRNALPNTPVQVRAVFRNAGTAPIEAAKLVGEVFLDGRRVAVLDGDALKVALGGEEELVAYFTPTQAGAYEAKVRVLYDGDRTGASSVPVLVGGEAPASQGSAGDSSKAGGDSDKGTPGPGALFALFALAGAAARRRR